MKLYNEDFIWEKERQKYTHGPQREHPSVEQEYRSKRNKIGSIQNTRKKERKIIRKNKWQEGKSPEKDCQRVDKNCN